MGFLERHREHRAERQRQEEEQAQRAAHAAWQAHVDQLRESLEVARTYQGEMPDGMSADGILLKPGERAYAIVDGAALIEPRRTPGHYQGGSQGFSVHIAKGVNYRVGRMKGTFVPGPEESMPIDVGVVMISDRRVVFAGPHQTREWLFDKLVGYSHAHDGAWTTLQVSNRQKASGFGYDAQHAANIAFRFDLALATHRGTRDQIVQDLQAQLDTLTATEPALTGQPHTASAEGTAATVGGTAEPVPQSAAAPLAQATPPVGAVAAQPPAAWYPDPTDPSSMRYWDGTSWTSHVAPAAATPSG